MYMPFKYYMPEIPNGTASESVYAWLDWLKDSGRLDIFKQYVFSIKNVYPYY